MTVWAHIAATALLVFLLAMTATIAAATIMGATSRDRIEFVIDLPAIARKGFALMMGAATVALVSGTVAFLIHRLGS